METKKDLSISVLEDNDLADQPKEKTNHTSNHDVASHDADVSTHEI